MTNETHRPLQQHDPAVAAIERELAACAHHPAYDREHETALLKRTAEERDGFFTVSQDLLCIAGMDGYFRRVNPAFEKIFGFPVSQVLAEPFLSLVCLEDREVTMLEIGKLAQGKLTSNFEIRCRCRDGSYRWITWNATPALEMGLFYAYGRDVTDEKRAEAELARERDLLRTLLDYSPDYIYFKDLNSRFLRCSRSLSERFGLRPEELIGKSDFDLYTEEHARPAYEDEQRIIKTGDPVIGKVEREVWKQGETMWVLTSKMPLTNKAGEIIGTFGLTKDITAMKDAEGKLEEAHKQLLETSRMAGMAEVATSVLHNVGNVLNSVNVSCSVVSEKVRKSRIEGVAKAAALMQEHGQDLPGFFARDARGAQLPAYLGNLATHLAAEREEVLKELGSLSGNIDHIKEIVAMQQSYSKVSGVRELVLPKDLVEDALRMNGAALDRHRIKVVREHLETPSIQVERHKVLQILINLLRNAKYACEDSRRPDKLITVRTELIGGNRVRITVIDNGVGIPAENLMRIFEHGFTTRTEGHGFGLHSGALAARELGGSLSGQSDGPGLGATFVLELPCPEPEIDL